jgi:hypothetical protein
LAAGPLVERRRERESVTWSWIDNTDPPSVPLVVSVTTYVKWDGSEHTNACDVTTGGESFICRRDIPPEDGPGNSRFILTPR